jgi:hypothetical protein
MNRVFVLVLVVMAAGAPAGCGLKRRHRCAASARYEGGIRIGRGYDFEREELARQFAVKDICLTYCRDLDPGVEAAYLKVTGGLHKDALDRLQIVANEPVSSVVTACQARCDPAIAASEVSYSCEYSGI